MSRSYRGRSFQNRWGCATVAPKARYTASERLALLNRMVKRANKAAGYSTAKEPKEWEYLTPAGETGVVSAHTKSEARAMVKRALNVPKRRRLPAEVVIERTK